VQDPRVPIELARAGAACGLLPGAKLGLLQAFVSA
jgi:hypothetical protein